MHGGLSFGKHVRISEVKVDMGNDDSFSDMVNFINLYYPKDADADERKYLSLADLGYSMVVDNGMIEQLFVEPGFEDNCESDPFEVSDADTLLAWLLSKELPNQKPDRNRFVG